MLWYASVYLFFDLDKRFNDYQMDVTLQYTNITIINVVTLLDIFKGYRTGYYDKGVLISDKKSIRKNY